MNDTVCFFTDGFGKCRCLSDTVCNGTSQRPECTFRKTEREYFESLDQAILKNREDGRCKSCAYRSMQCLLSSERKRSDL